MNVDVNVNESMNCFLPQRRRDAEGLFGLGSWSVDGARVRDSLKI